MEMTALYGAAGVAHHSELARLLLTYGADPNDGETPYHAPEGYDNAVLNVLLESGKLNETSKTCMLRRKADWHDYEGLRLLLESGASADSALHHALRRDNHVRSIALLLDHGAESKSAIELAARRGRADVLALLKQRGISTRVDGLAGLIAACAEGDHEAAQSLAAQQPELRAQLIAEGGTLLAEFAGNGNVEGLETLLDLGVNVASLYETGDIYFGIAKNSTALHVAAWRAWPSAVKLLLRRGAPVNAADGQGRSPLLLAVKACVDSYWTDRRSPESAQALLEAGATRTASRSPAVTKNWTRSSAKIR
jgi:ankyrin repeat protein